MASHQTVHLVPSSLYRAMGRNGHCESRLCTRKTPVLGARMAAHECRPVRSNHLLLPLMLQIPAQPTACHTSKAVCSTAAAAAAGLPCAAQATFLPLCAASDGFDPGLPLCAASAGVTGICATAALCAQASVARATSLPGCVHCS